MREIPNQNPTRLNSEIVGLTASETDIHKLFAEGRLPLPDSNLCDCEFCRAFARYAHTRKHSVLATIDVYSSPDETDSSPSSVN
jgi:hypothetical protein